MSVEDRLAAALRQQYEATRENELLRDMREAQAAKIAAESKESLDKQGKVTERMSTHIAELAQRQRRGGGWGTSSVLDRNDGQLRFGTEEDEDDRGYRPPPPSYAAPAPPPPPPPPVAPAPAARRAPARRPVDDDDDYEQQSWLS